MAILMPSDSIPNELLSSEFQRFAPRVIADRRFETEAAIARSGVTMFVDIAGFTSLSERLAAHGTAGTEQLGQILRIALGGAIDAVDEHGGDTLSFGGDAITAIFDGTDPDCWARARSAGERIIEIVDSLAGRPTLIGALHLSVKVGISSGTVTSVFCPREGRATLVHFGSGLDAAVSAEETAVPGHIVERRLIGGAAPKRAVRPCGDLVRATVPPLIVSRIESGHRLRDSHRRATAVFVSLPHLDGDDPDDIATLQTLVSRAGELIDELGGELIYCMGGDKGLVLFGVFGLLVSRSDDAARAITFVERLRRRSTAVLSAGISTGLIWVGIIEGEHRAFVGVLGDTANQGARLMNAAAPGTTLIEERTRIAAGEAITTSARQLIAVKGKADPLDVCTVEQVTGRSGAFEVTTTPLVGRSADVESIHHRLELCRDGSGNLVQIVGPAGIGKTCVAEAVLQRFATSEIVIELGRFDGYGLGRPFGPFPQILRDRLDLTADADLGELSTAVRSRHPELERSTPLLAAVLGIAADDNNFTRQLRAGERAELTRGVVVSLLRSVDRPTLLYLEDVHWADEASAAILSSLGEPDAIALLSVLTTRRPTDGDHEPVREAWHLGPLSDEALSTIVTDTWTLLGGSDLDPGVVEQIVHRSAGNPLFAALICELVRHRWQPGLPIPAVPLFEELLAVLTERLDRLPADLRDLALRLAVIGRTVHEADFVQIFDLDSDETRRGVDHLVAEGFVTRTPQGVALRYPTLGDALRDGASHEERSTLHLAVAQWLMAHDGPAREVAGHLMHTAREFGSVRWFREARDDAHAVWSEREALRWAEQAALAEGSDHRDTLAVSEIAIVVGEYGTAERALIDLSGIDLATNDRSDLCFFLGKLELETGRPAEAAAHLREARELGSTRSDLGWPLTMALCDLGQFDEAEQEARSGLHSTDQRLRLDSFANLGVALARKGDFDDALNALHEARSVAAETGDLMRLIHATGDLAGVLFLTADLVGSITFLDEAAALAQQVGAHRALTMALGNQSQVRLAAGDLAGAERVAAAAVTATLGLPDPGLALLFLETPVVIAEARGELLVAADWWQRHAALEHSLGRRHEAAISTLRYAALVGNAGSTELAESLVATARSLLSGSDGSESADISEDFLAHQVRAERSLAGSYEPPPEVASVPDVAVAVGRLDETIPEVTRDRIEGLFDRLEAMLLPTDVGAAVGETSRARNTPFTNQI